MTGYGKADFVLWQNQWQIELRAVNSKVLDFNPRLPQRFKALENDIRKIISTKLQRGKIDILISEQNNNNAADVHINQSAAQRYYTEIKATANTLSIPLSDTIMSDILRMPEVVRQADNEMTETDSQAILQAIARASDALDLFRTKEGKSLQSDFTKRTKKITDYIEQIKAIKDKRITRLRERFNNELEKTFSNVDIDRNRLEQEIIFYIEKLDITEEIVRLRQHINYFSETMEAPDSQGKKLGFITQEMGREINTIGSKANDADIQHIVVNMKDELEKIKEQMLNIL